MRKISIFIMLGLLAIIAVHCVDNVISQQTDKLITERDPLYRDLKILEYRVRELGWIQSGVAIHDAGLNNWQNFELTQSYQDTNYAVIITPRSQKAYFAARPVDGNTFKVTTSTASATTFSWLTIGQ